MSLPDLIALGEWFFFGYYAVLHLIYLVLIAAALAHLGRYRRHRRMAGLPPVLSGLEPPVSIIIPLYNESKGAVQAVKTLLGQQYPAFEVVLVNDGSQDDTLEIVREAFGFAEADLAPNAQLPHQPIRGHYRSERQPSLILLDKANGGKSDALNAGLCYARHPLACMVDGDSVLEPDSLYRAVQSFVAHPETLAVGATLGVLNGCTMRPDGFVRRVGTASNYWVLIQTLEYIRAFLMNRLGWTALGAMPLISGAFGLYERTALIVAGGFRRDTHGEDLEITLRLHRYARQAGRPYRIDFVPGYTCWTEVPADYRTLRRQRITWHVSLLQTLAMNRGLLREGGVAGWAVYPFMVVFEALTPLVELGGYLFVVAAWLLGVLSTEALVAFLVLVLGVGLLISACGLLIETRTARSFEQRRSLLVLFAFGLIENVGYRQLYAVWRFTGLMKWLWDPGTSLMPNLALQQTHARDDA